MVSGLAALARSTHPGPAIAVTLISVVLAIGAGLDPWRVALLGVAVGLNQASVGLSNDWIDAARDRAVGRTDKPVALGQISASAVRSAAIACAVAAVLLTAPLGWAATLAHTVFIGSAWAYNAGLKSTAVSVLPYVLSFGILPLVVTLARSEPALAAPWALALGALLGVAAHFANVLPDLDDDRATGVSGLPHRLGRRASGIATWAALVAASAIAVTGAGEPTVVQWAGLAATLAIAAVGTVLVLRRPPTRLLFQLIITAALVNVVLLAFAGERLLA
ncbi:MAG: UbiA family prenyltransferase [Burkholderiaceae bacterium]|nr:UbiA family prenyltransferase [Microbacteriaceae bacterium]